MSEYEPDDSRDVTQSSHQAPGEPPRTGYREDGARLRAQAEQGQVPPREQGQQSGNDGFATEGDGPGHPDRFADSVPEQEQQQQQEQHTQAEAQKRDRWSEAADREEYTPEGK